MKIIKVDKKNNKSLSGIFFIIDGMLYVGIHDEIEILLHMDMFKQLINQERSLFKYRFYPYYMFPRGSIIQSQVTDWIIVNKPIELSKSQLIKLLDDFHQLGKRIEMIEGEHYSLEFVKSQIKSNRWSNKDIENEIDFAVTFYLSQIKLYGGREND